MIKGTEIMSNSIQIKRKHKRYWLQIMMIMFLALVFVSAKEVQASTHNVELNQYHASSEFEYSVGGLNDYFYEVYPNENQLDYKKFMKYTYKISDDSVIGLKENTNKDAVALWLTDAEGKFCTVMPYNIVIYALAPGKATLNVYDKSKLVDKFIFTVIADVVYSPSSYVDETGDTVGDSISYTDTKASNITKIEIEEENNLIKKFAKTAANLKYKTTNQRILAALNAVINYGCTRISENKYDELTYLSWKKGTTLTNKYRTSYAMLVDKKSVSIGYAKVNKAVLNNLGFRCTTDYFEDGTQNFGCETWNNVEIYRDLSEEEQSYDESEEEGLSTRRLTNMGFGATNELQSEYDFSSEDAESIYSKTHLPAWVIGEDTAEQVISVGQTKQLTSCDLNDNSFSSDTSIVTVQNGKITGVNTGVAIVYRYNDNYCDVFYVLVKQKGSPKTIHAKIYTKTTKSYFAAAKYAPYIKGGQNDTYQIKDWENLRIFELEPIFGKGTDLTTKYSKGELKCYLNKNGHSSLLCTTGSEE